MNAAMLAQQLASVCTIVIGVYLISAGKLTMGGLIACSMLASRALAPIGQIAGLLTQYHNAITALAALDQIVEHAGRAAARRALPQPPVLSRRHRVPRRELRLPRIRHERAARR